MMQSVARLPRFIVVLEAAGGLLILGALLLINHWLPLPDQADARTLATVLFIAGVVLMLPAACCLAIDVAHRESYRATAVQSD
jgi:hypothetical protein